MDTFIVALIVLAAVIAVLRFFVRSFRTVDQNPGGCGCSCTGCDVVQNCTDAPENANRIV